MDLGDLSSSTFKTFYDEASSRPTMEDKRRTIEFIKATTRKLQIAKNLQIHYTELLYDNEVVVDRLGSDEFGGNNNYHWMSLALRASTYQTAYHLIYRYQILLMRDLLRARESLGLTLSHEARMEFMNQTMSLREDAPNIHELFLYTNNMEEVEESANFVPLQCLWRSTD